MRRPVADGLDPVAIRVEQESGVVVRMVGGAEAGRAVAAPARCETGGVEGVHGRAARRAEAPVAVIGRHGGRRARADGQVGVAVIPGAVRATP